MMRLVLRRCRSPVHIDMPPGERYRRGKHHQIGAAENLGGDKSGAGACAPALLIHGVTTGGGTSHTILSGIRGPDNLLHSGQQSRETIAGAGV
jgi:hypothetical protein